MKKGFRIITMTFTFLLIFGLIMPQGVNAANDYTVTFEGQKLELALPIININGRLMYPFRQILEAMGATVNWDAENRVASGTLNGKTVVFSIDSNQYLANGGAKNMDEGVTAFIRGGSTYIPIRYAAEALGYAVGWDDATKTAIITPAMIIPTHKFDDNMVIDFKDEVIKEAVIKLIGNIEPITYKQVKTIESLDSINDVNTLDDLIYFTGLKKLEIFDYTGSDANALIQIKNSLIQLNLCWAQNLKDFRFLSELSNLKELDISATKISSEDIAFLPANLELLRLDGCTNIDDINILKRFGNLTTLGLANLWLTDMPVLSSLTSLEVLYLSYNLLEDISMLTTLTNLKILDISDNRVSDISPLVGLMKNGLMLDVNSNPIKDYSPLENKNIIHFRLDLGYDEFKQPFDAARQIVSKSINDGMSDEEKYKVLAEELCKNIEYDYGYLSGDGTGRSYTPYGALIDGIAVCQGYQEAYLMLCTVANLPCYTIYGYLAGVPHGWNIIKVDDKFYNVDTTFMDTASDSDTVDYTFFLKSDYFFQQMGRSDYNVAPDLICVDRSKDLPHGQ